MAAARILVVHYDPKALVRLRRMLEEGGYEVLEARDGSTAMTAMLESEPDGVLLEAMLPKVHGFEVCQDLKKTRHGRKVPILIMTTVYKGRKYRDEAIHTYGADNYIELPIEDAQFLSIVRSSVPAARTGGSEVDSRG
jgi:DNA-binding response OmpR family regulator